MINDIRKKVLNIDNFNSQLSALIENKISTDPVTIQRSYGGSVPWHANGITFVEITVDDLLHSPHFERFLRDKGLNDLITLVEEYKLHARNYKIADLDDQDEEIINQHKQNMDNVKKNIAKVLGMSEDAEIISCKTMQEDKNLDYHNSKVPFYSHHIAQLDLMINMSGPIKDDLKAIRPELVDIVKYHTLMAEIAHRKFHYPIMSHNTPKLKKELKAAYDNYLHNIGGEKEAHYRRIFKEQLIKTNQDLNRLTVAASKGLSKKEKRDRRRELNRDLADQYKAINKAIKNDCRKVAFGRNIIKLDDEDIDLDQYIRKFEVGDSGAKGHIAAENNKHHYVTFHHADGQRRTQSGTTSDSTSHNRDLKGKLAITFIETDADPKKPNNEFGLHLLQTPSLSAVPKGNKNFKEKNILKSDQDNIIEYILSEDDPDDNVPMEADDEANFIPDYYKALKEDHTPPKTLQGYSNDMIEYVKQRINGNIDEIGSDIKKRYETNMAGALKVINATAKITDINDARTRTAITELTENYKEALNKELESYNGNNKQEIIAASVENFKKSLEDIITKNKKGFKAIKKYVKDNKDVVKKHYLDQYKKDRILDIKNNKMKQIEKAAKERNPDFDLNQPENHIITVDLTSPGSSSDEDENHQDLSFKCDTQAVHLFNAKKLKSRTDNNDGDHLAPALARVILSYGINGADYSSEEETDLMNVGASLLLLHESLKDCPDTPELNELRERIAEVLVEFNDEYEKYLKYLNTTKEPMHDRQSFAEYLAKNSHLNAEYFINRLPPLGPVPVNNDNLKELTARQRMALVFYKVVQSGKYSERRNAGQTFFLGRDRRGRIMQAMASALAGDKSNRNVFGHFHCKSNLDRGKENGDYALELSRGGINNAINNCLTRNHPDIDRDLRWMEKALNNSVERNGADGSIFQQQSLAQSGAGSKAQTPKKWYWLPSSNTGKIILGAIITGLIIAGIATGIGALIIGGIAAIGAYLVTCGGWTLFKNRFETNNFDTMEIKQGVKVGKQSHKAKSPDNGILNKIKSLFGYGKMDKAKDKLKSYSKKREKYIAEEREHISTVTARYPSINTTTFPDDDNDDKLYDSLLQTMPNEFGIKTDGSTSGMENIMGHNGDYSIQDEQENILNGSEAELENAIIRVAKSMSVYKPNQDFNESLLRNQLKSMNLEDKQNYYKTESQRLESMQSSMTKQGITNDFNKNNGKIPKDKSVDFELNTSLNSSFEIISKG